MSIFSVLGQIASGFGAGFGGQTGASNLGGLFAPLKEKMLEIGAKVKSPATGTISGESPSIWQNLGNALGSYTGKQAYQQSPMAYNLAERFTRPKTKVTPEQKKTAFDWIKEITGREMR